jgi:excisionase family DNA binding protein
VIVALGKVDYSVVMIAKEGLVKDMGNNKQMSTMLTVREVSRLLHIHSNTLRRWSDHGVIKAYRIGPRGDRRFRPEDIAILLLQESKGIPFEGSESESPESLDQFALSR